MLLNLHVKNLVIIDEVDVDFTKHLNVLTGETGAGKSIIIGSINAALGGKIAKDMIRKDAEYALIELAFQIEDKKVKEHLEELGVTLEDDMLLISRKITATRTNSDYRKICLCRTHHVEDHTIGEKAFQEKYKVYGIIVKGQENGLEELQQTK